MTFTLPDSVTVPETPDQLADSLRDAAWCKDVLASKDVLGAVMNAYAQKYQGPGTDLHDTIAAEAARVVTEMLNTYDADADRVKHLNLDPQARGAGMMTSHRQGAAHNPDAPGAQLDNEFSGIRQFIGETWHLNPNPDARAKIERLKDAYASTVPADGGFLVPEVLRAQLLSLALETSVVRPRATVLPMETARVALPKIDVTTNATSVFGGLIAFWGEEGAALTDSSAKFGQTVLDAKKLTGYSAVPNELLRDSIITFAALIERLWPLALSFYEDRAFMGGTGVGEPLGFIGASNPAVALVAAEAGQLSGTILFENLVNMYSRMLPSSLNSAVWVCSPDAIPQLFTMALSVGTGGSPVMITNATGPAPMSIFGRPLVVSEKASTVGTRGDLCFVDLAYYLVGDRQLMTTASSTDYLFGNDKTAYRIIERVDGRPWLDSAITPANGSANTLSPFVEIATR